MPNDAEWEELTEKEHSSADTFASRLADFIKWTTATSVAAVAWVGAALPDLTGVSRLLAILSLLLLTLSLILAIVSMKRMLDASSNEWDLSRSGRSLKLVEMFEKGGASKEFVSRKRTELRGIFERALLKSSSYYGSTFFNVPATWHTALLALGIAVYGISQLAVPLFPP
jgi:hypothetical protein